VDVPENFVDSVSIAAAATAAVDVVMLQMLAPVQVLVFAGTGQVH
jgi:hypothetical protein